MARLATCRASAGFLRAAEQWLQSHPVCGMPPSWAMPRTTMRGAVGGAAARARAANNASARSFMWLFSHRSPPEPSPLPLSRPLPPSLTGRGERPSKTTRRVLLPLLPVREGGRGREKRAGVMRVYWHLFPACHRPPICAHSSLVLTTQNVLAPALNSQAPEPSVVSGRSLSIRVRDSIMSASDLGALGVDAAASSAGT